MIRLTSLARLQFRRLSFTGMKNYLGLVILILYVWVTTFAVFFYFGDEIHAKIPQEVWVISMLCMVIPDALIKLLFVPYSSVMDAFLKTRPIPQAKWKRFLALSHFWDPNNLIIPISLVPLCFLSLPWISALPLFLILYFLCVLDGYLVMRVKGRHSYQSEKKVSTSFYGGSSLSGRHARFGLQYKSFLRSKRMWISVVFCFAFFVFEYITSYTVSGKLRTSGTIMLFMAVYYPICEPLQFGLGIEANSFSALWTRPGHLSEILNDKYRFGMMMGGIIATIMLILHFTMHTPILEPLSYVFFVVGLGSMIHLVQAYRCVPFDLFGTAFFNHQGTSSSFSLISVVGIVIVMTVAIYADQSIPAPYSHAVLTGLGLLGFAIHRPVFRMSEKAFLKKRYKYMENYSKK
jgi:hypothetical protein